MKFKPVTKKYKFDNEILVKNYPDYLRVPIATWIHGVLSSAQIWKKVVEIYVKEWIEEDFLNNLNINFREPFPSNYKNFLPFVLENGERTTNIIALCLQNYATPEQARQLEKILAIGGSGYTVIFTADKPSPYQKGVADLVDRVPEVVSSVSEEILKIQPLIKEAWISCYSQNPDYSKTVSKCVDALEGLFRKYYFPNDPKPSLGKFLNNFKNNPAQLSFKGDTIINPKNLLTDLGDKFIPIRGHHTSGTGRIPTKEEAEFVLHYTVFVFSLHN